MLLSTKNSTGIADSVSNCQCHLPMSARYDCPSFRNRKYSDTHTCATVCWSLLQRPSRNALTPELRGLHLYFSVAITPCCNKGVQRVHFFARSNRSDAYVFLLRWRACSCSKVMVWQLSSCTTMFLLQFLKRSGKAEICCSSSRNHGQGECVVLSCLLRHFTVP